MEQARLLIAIVLSAAVFLVWQFFFVDRDAVQKTSVVINMATTTAKATR